MEETHETLTSPGSASSKEPQAQSLPKSLQILQHQQHLKSKKAMMGSLQAPHSIMSPSSPGQLMVDVDA